jgi:hypothetical protein
MARKVDEHAADEYQHYQDYLDDIGDLQEEPAEGECVIAAISRQVEDWSPQLVDHRRPTSLNYLVNCANCSPPAAAWGSAPGCGGAALIP